MPDYEKGYIIIGKKFMNIPTRYVWITYVTLNWKDYRAQNNCIRIYLNELLQIFQQIIAHFQLSICKYISVLKSPIVRCNLYLYIFR